MHDEQGVDLKEAPAGPRAGLGAVGVALSGTDTEAADQNACEPKDAPAPSEPKRLGEAALSAEDGKRRQKKSDKKKEGSPGVKKNRGGGVGAKPTTIGDNSGLSGDGSSEQSGVKIGLGSGRKASSVKRSGKSSQLRRGKRQAATVKREDDTEAEGLVGTSEREDDTEV